MLQTGAAIRSDGELDAGAASVIAVRDARTGQVTDIRVDYGPGTSRAVIDVHTQVAGDLITNGGAGGVMRRTFGDESAFGLGTRGEEVSLEVAKHEALLTQYDGALQSSGLTAADRAVLTRAQDDARFELRAYQFELGHIRGDRALGDAPAFGTIYVKRSAQHWLDPSNGVTRDPLAQSSFGQWRTGVAQVAPYKTSIDPNMVRQRAEHFKAANQNLRDELARDPALAARLGLMRRSPATSSRRAFRRRGASTRG